MVLCEPIRHGQVFQCLMLRKLPDCKLRLLNHKLFLNTESRPYFYLHTTEDLSHLSVTNGGLGFSAELQQQWSDPETAPTVNFVHSEIFSAFVVLFTFCLQRVKSPKPSATKTFDSFPPMPKSSKCRVLRCSSSLSAAQQSRSLTTTLFREQDVTEHSELISPQPCAHKKA